MRERKLRVKLWALETPSELVPCKHPGCLHHVTHPCEGCGRIAGHWPEDIDLPAWDALSDETLKAIEAA